VLDGGEIIELAIKPSMWRPLFDSLSWLVVGFVLAAVVVWFGRPIRGLSLNGTAQVILLVPFVQLAIAVIRWVPTWYVLTNRRIIVIQGVRAPRIASCLLLDVRNTYLHVALAERLTRLGTITFVADHSDRTSYIWQSVARPEEIHAKIRRAIENALDVHGLST
jgi:hypothetical protein